MNEKYEALRTLLILRQGAELQTSYDVSEMVFFVEYLEWDRFAESVAVQFVASAHTWGAAMERAEAEAVAYIEKVTS